jgi:hypothetical protein
VELAQVHVIIDTRGAEPSVSAGNRHTDFSFLSHHMQVVEFSLFPHRVLGPQLRRKCT